jgi:hypothetical protein
MGKVTRSEGSGLIKMALRNFRDGALSSEHARIYSIPQLLAAETSLNADRSIVRCSVIPEILASFMKP